MDEKSKKELLPVLLSIAVTSALLLILSAFALMINQPPEVVVSWLILACGMATLTAYGVVELRTLSGAPRIVLIVAIAVGFAMIPYFTFLWAGLNNRLLPSVIISTIEVGIVHNTMKMVFSTLKSKLKPVKKAEQS